MRIGRRLFLTYMFVGLIAVIAAGGLLYDTLTEEARAGVEERLAVGIRMLATDLSRDAPADSAALDEYIDALALAADTRLTIIARDGRVVADSEFDGAALAALDDHGSRAEVREALARGEGRSIRYSRSVGTDLLYGARRIDGGPWAGGVARMAVPLTRIQAARSAARGEILAALAFALALAAVAGALWARRLSGPIVDLGRAAERVRQGDLSARIHVETGDELQDLARAFDAARNRLADGIAVATAERDRLEGVLDGMIEGVLVTDQAGRIVLANAALHAIFGLDRIVTGRTIMEAILQSEAAAALTEAAATKGEVTREIRLTWPAEKVLALHAVGIASGGAVGVFHDMTALKRADAVRRDFVANVSHELRTPLATLGGYAEALAESSSGPGGPDPADVQETASVIRRNVARLSDVVSDLLQLSRIEAEGFAPDQEEFMAADLVDELAAEWRSRAEERGIRFSAVAEPGLKLHADRGLLRQALDNLLDNAVKYCSREAEVRLEAKGDPEEVEFIVSDTGPGIPYEDQPRVFERFYRVDKARSRATGGTGLGLSIVKHVAEVHGGRVALESSPGAGTTFRLLIPSISH